MMNQLGFLSYAATLIRLNIRSALALRGAFLLQTFFMLLNNVVFFMVWVILFTKYPTIRGWGIKDIMAVQGFAVGSYALVMILFGGVRHIAKAVRDGDLDSYLTRPKPVLPQLLLSYAHPSAFGDLLTCIGMIALSGYGGWEKGLIWLFGLTCGTLIFLATTILIQSLAFWMGNSQSMVRTLFEYMVSFMTFPPHIYSGFLKMILFTVFPAAYISLLPIEMLREFHGVKAVIVLGATVFFCSTAVWVFHRGLRRYESGNLMGFQIV